MPFLTVLNPQRNKISASVTPPVFRTGSWVGVPVGAGTTQSITIPSAVQVGDIMFLGNALFGIFTGVPTPTGWTALAAVHSNPSGGNGCYVATWWKIATVGDVGGSTVVTLNVGNAAASASELFAYSNPAVVPINQVATSNTNNTNFASLASSPVTPTVNQTRIVQIWGGCGTGSQVMTPPSVNRGAVDGGGLTLNTDMCASDQAGPAAGVSSGTVTMNQGATTTTFGACCVNVALA